MFTMHSGEQTVRIPVGGVTLYGDLHIPPEVQGIVIFAHGSGSSRLSPRNRSVAEALHPAGLATLLFDLLTEEEDEAYANRFNIRLLAERLVGITRFISNRSDTGVLPIGYFGASTGAAAALQAAAELGDMVHAVVSRGGRPDLALPYLDRVEAPVLLIVGGHDPDVLELNRIALGKLRKLGKLAIVPKATHLFEEPGALERVAALALDWFERYVCSVQMH